MATSSPVLASRQGRPLALVTDARHSVGASIAVELAQRGFEFALIDIDDDGVHETLPVVESHGVHARLHQHDPVDSAVHRALVESIVSGFLALLNGHQSHMAMLTGHQAMRPLPYFVDLFKLADAAGLLRQPELAIARMKTVLACYGLSQD